MSELPKLHPEEISRVLSGVEGAAGASAAGASGPQPYSLREPLAIPPQAEKRARENLARVVAELGESFAQELGPGVVFELDGLLQQRATPALATVPAPAWVFPLARDGGGGVVLALHPRLALALVDLALGGTGQAAEAVRLPTLVEARLLSRLVASAAARIGPVLGALLTAAPAALGAVPPSILAPGEMAAVGLLRARAGACECGSLLLVTASLLVPPPDRAPAVEHGRVGPLASRLLRLPVAVRPVLLAGTIRMGELMELEPGKVLRLDAPVDGPLELRVAGTARFAGRVVREREDAAVFAVQRAIGRRVPPGGR